MTATILPVLVQIDNGEPGVRYAIVPSHGGAYAAGDDGSIWSCLKQRAGKPGRTLTHDWNRLSGTVVDSGYLYVTTRHKDGKWRPTSVHSMVNEAWHGPCPPGMETLHRNGVPLDCRESNLRWGTHSENMIDRGLHGDPTFRGEGHPNAGMTDEIVIRLREMVASGSTIAMAAYECGVPIEAAFGAVRGRTWTHLPGAIRAYKLTSKEDKAVIDALRAEGLGVQEIADRTGLTYLAVYNRTVRRERSPDRAARPAGACSSPAQHTASRPD